MIFGSYHIFSQVKLLTGHTAFGSVDVGKFIQYEEYLRHLRKAGKAAKLEGLPACMPVYTKFFDSLERMSDISPAAVDCIRGFLSVEDTKRLGHGDKGSGLRDILAHPFFSDIDWEGLEFKQVPPPHKPFLPPHLARMGGHQ